MHRIGINPVVIKKCPLLTTRQTMIMMNQIPDVVIR